MVAGVCSSGWSIHLGASTVVCHFPVPGPWWMGSGLCYRLRTPKQAQMAEQNVRFFYFFQRRYLCGGICGLIALKYITISAFEKGNLFVFLCSLCSLSYLWTHTAWWVNWVHSRSRLEGLHANCETHYCICYEQIYFPLPTRQKLSLWLWLMARPVNRACTIRN